MTYAVIRVRGQPDVKYDIKHTMMLLGLTKVNNCIIIPETPPMKGMLQVVKDYCTWGEVDKGTLTKLIHTRGKITGNNSITNEVLREISYFDTVDNMVEAIIKDDYKIKDIKSVKPVFRLHPPIKGYEGNKRSYKNGGALGYRGRAVNNLIDRML